jgi:hypothetical protein
MTRVVEASMGDTSLFERAAKTANHIPPEVECLRFAIALLADWEDEQAQLRAHPDLQVQLQRGPGPNGGEHGPIGQFLSAMIRWAEDNDHSGHYAAAPDWNLFAFMLLAGSRYE